jgi:hypothetical protein
LQPLATASAGTFSKSNSLNGAIYRYLDVPPAVYRDLMSAESKARFYDSNIRRHYRSILVRPQSSKNQGVN